MTSMIQEPVSISNDFIQHAINSMLNKYTMDIIILLANKIGFDKDEAYMSIVTLMSRIGSFAELEKPAAAAAVTATATATAAAVTANDDVATTTVEKGKGRPKKVKETVIENHIASDSSDVNDMIKSLIERDADIDPEEIPVKPVVSKKMSPVVPVAVADAVPAKKEKSKKVKQSDELKQAEVKKPAKVKQAEVKQAEVKQAEVKQAEVKKDVVETKSSNDEMVEDEYEVDSYDLNVKEFHFQGKLYLRDQDTNELYDKETESQIGSWDEKNNKIVLC